MTFADLFSGIDYADFQKDFDRWWQMSGERQWSVATMDRVFADMLRTAARCYPPHITGREDVLIQTAIEMAAVEHPMRQAYRARLTEGRRIMNTDTPAR